MGPEPSEPNICRWGDFMIARIAGLIGITTLITLVPPATAQEPAAIVEEVDAPTAGVAFMDYLVPGQVIDLKSNGTLKLGYLRSCFSETITGGRVVIGRERSAVEGGKIERRRVECDGGNLKLSDEQAGKSAVLVLRRPPAPRGGSIPRPAFKIYGASPIIKTAGSAGAVSFERLDRPEPGIDVELRGGTADLAATGRSLAPGGLYWARAGGRAVVFKVDPFARAGAGPIIGRLVAF